ncbi:hypothetical protein SH501x_000922 [Pirellulaceae bacterium SH501]
MESESANNLQVRHLVAEAMAAIVTRIILRRDTAANWDAAEAILEEGELGFETDTRQLKIGDGTSEWAGLDYLGNFVWGTPATSASPGRRGMCMYDGSYAYFCIADNTWKRVPLGSW